MGGSLLRQPDGLRGRGSWLCGPASRPGCLCRKEELGTACRHASLAGAATRLTHFHIAPAPPPAGETLGPRPFGGALTGAHARRPGGFMLSVGLLLRLPGRGSTWLLPATSPAVTACGYGEDEEGKRFVTWGERDSRERERERDAQERERDSRERERDSRERESGSGSGTRRVCGTGGIGGSRSDAPARQRSRRGARQPARHPLRSPRRRTQGAPSLTGAGAPPTNPSAAARRTRAPPTQGRRTRDISHNRRSSAYPHHDLSRSARQIMIAMRRSMNDIRIHLAIRDIS
jgi:hypothetical protein